MYNKKNLLIGAPGFIGRRMLSLLKAQSDIFVFTPLSDGIDRQIEWLV